MSLRFMGSPSVFEKRDEYKDFVIVVGITLNLRSPKEYVRIYDGEFRIPELEYFVKPGVGQIVTDPSRYNEQNANIKSLFRDWTWSGYIIEDLEGLAEAANKLLQQLRESQDYPLNRKVNMRN